MRRVARPIRPSVTRSRVRADEYRCWRRSRRLLAHDAAARNRSSEDQSQTEALLKELTQAVRKFSVEQRRVPKNLEELVANGYLPGVPSAPAGKQFAIDKSLQVTLVKR